MEKEDIALFIDKLRSQNSAKESMFGFYKDPENITGYIKSNKQGLELYAAELLEASITDDTHSIINEDLIDENSEFFFDSVDIIKSSKLESEYFENQKRSWKDHVLGIGLGIILTILVFCSIIGFIMIIKWIF
ncbi:hypothetical protein [Nonlabens sp. Asnod3-A02]|uniref:hypothetical protein n=1 Tax=Nonlabens sp. Asnod3-A02 TaxID=3160579 RepID=UPI003865AD77